MTSKSRAEPIVSTNVETPRTRRQFPPITQEMPADSLVRAKQILGDPACEPPLPAYLSVSRSKFYALVRDGLLPPPVRLPGSTSSLWHLGSLRAAVARLTGSQA